MAAEAESLSAILSMSTPNEQQLNVSYCRYIYNDWTNLFSYLDHHLCAQINWTSRKPLKKKHIRRDQSKKL